MALKLRLSTVQHPENRFTNSKFWSLLCAAAWSPCGWMPSMRYTKPEPLCDRRSERLPCDSITVLISRYMANLAKKKKKNSIHCKRKQWREGERWKSSPLVDEQIVNKLRQSWRWAWGWAWRQACSEAAHLKASVSPLIFFGLRFFRRTIFTKLSLIKASWCRQTTSVLKFETQ